MRETTEALVRHIMQEHGFTAGAIIAPENEEKAFANLTEALAREIEKRDVIIERNENMRNSTLSFLDETSKQLELISSAKLSRKERAEFLSRTLHTVVETTMKCLETPKTERAVTRPGENEEGGDGDGDSNVEDKSIKAEDLE
ncbi:hypothetical protein E8E12_011322 [Didymella heteroderae]|uniref:Uncharacterized protein n=1 Tax=Didymella heteroderae TaxID=1769908 RepID=A0A9P4X1V1_9PLEO|nr:hypothetical protein E8E12_011322 [Didymella heteroderae]